MVGDRSATIAATPAGTRVSASGSYMLLRPTPSTFIQSRELSWAVLVNFAPAGC